MAIIDNLRLSILISRKIWKLPREYSDYVCCFLCPWFHEYCQQWQVCAESRRPYDLIVTYV